MAEHPVLTFCPYLVLSKPVEIGGWRIGRVEAFDTWADDKFRIQALAFLKKFVDAHGQVIEHPCLIGRASGTIDGASPSEAEAHALQAALEFVCIDSNPRYDETLANSAWSTTTSDNAQVFVWPIDVDSGYVTLTRYGLVQETTGGFRTSDEKFQVRSPLELFMPLRTSIDVYRLAACYELSLKSIQNPSLHHDADRIRTAIRWLAKAWKNSPSLGMADRIVFLKTGFEALTGESKTHKAAKRLKGLFESVPGTTAADSGELVWSPEEKPVNEHHWKNSKGEQQTEMVTDLEDWFMAFGGARNQIIHDGVVPSLKYDKTASAYSGHLFHTGEFVLRAALKVSMTTMGYPDLWRSAAHRAAKKVFEKTSG